MICRLLQTFVVQCLPIGSDRLFVTLAVPIYLVSNFWHAKGQSSKAIQVSVMSLLRMQASIER